MKKIFMILIIGILCISLFSCDDIADNSVNKESENTTENSDSNEIENKVNMVDDFIAKYNKSASVPITNVVSFDVSDKSSGHYRTEYRLGAFKDSIAKSGKIGDVTIDIVNCGWDKDELRIYVDDIDLEQAKNIIRIASPIMDNALTSEEIQEVLDYLTEYKSANGKYYGKLGLVYTGDLMIKLE